MVGLDGWMVGRLDGLLFRLQAPSSEMNLRNKEGKKLKYRENEVKVTETEERTFLEEVGYGLM